MFRDTHTVPSGDGMLCFMGGKSDEESTRERKHPMRLSLTLRSTSASQTARRRGEKDGRRGREGRTGGKEREKRLEIRLPLGAWVHFQNNNFPRHFTGECVR